MIKYFENTIYKGKSNRLKESFILKNFPDFHSLISKLDGSSFLEKVFIFYKGSHKCYCGSNTKFISFSKGYLKFCSVKCASTCRDVRLKYNKTCKLKYGVENVSKCSDIKLKKENTCLKKYGKSTYLQSDKVKSLLIGKYGADNPFKLESVQMKIKQTMLEKYGVEYSFLNKEVREKSKKSIIEKYGVSHYSKSLKFKFDLGLRNYDLYNIQFKKFNQLSKYTLLSKNRNSNTVKHEVCGNTFEIQSQLIRKRISSDSEVCKICNPYTPSYKEEEIIKFIELQNIEVKKNYRDKYEIDAFIPSLKIGFEYNGLYWHSELFKDKHYHQEKTEYFKNKGIQLIHIWQDDWENKKEIIKSIILSKLKKIPNIIGSRKCEISEINDKDSKDFLNKNHLQGWCVSKYRICLKMNNEIVSIATFGKKRMNLGYNPNKNDSGYELLRFCNKLNYSIIGSLPKILNFFIKKYSPSEILTYCDKSISNGDIYSKNGFSYIGQTSPNYHYIIDGVRKNRFSYSKQNLKKMGYSETETEREIMFGNKIYRIYDCGSIKYRICI